MIRFRSRFEHRGLISGLVVSLCLCFPAVADAQRATSSRTSAETAPTDAGNVSSGGATSGSGDMKSNRAGRDNALCANDGSAEGRTQPMSTADRKMVRQLAQVHLQEIKMSGLATAISDNKAVRAYAQKTLEEHMKGMDELRKLASRSDVILPGGLDKEQAATLHNLALQTGADFDKQYLDQDAAESHARRLFEEASKASSPALKSYAAGYLPLLDRHLALAQKLREDPKNGVTAVQSETRAGQSTSTEAASGTSSNPSNNSSGERGGASLSGSAVKIK